LPPARRKEKLPMQILKYSLQQLKKRFFGNYWADYCFFANFKKKLAANSAKSRKAAAKNKLLTCKLKKTPKPKIKIIILAKKAD